MPLSQFGVVQEHTEQPGAVLVTCFDGAQTLLVFISLEVIADYFRRRDLTARQRNLLVMRNLDHLVPVISGRYERGEVSIHASPTGRTYARIDLTAADLEQAPEKLTDSVLDIDAHAGFQAPFGIPDQLGLSGPQQTSLTPPVAGVASQGSYLDVSYADVSAPCSQPDSQITLLPTVQEALEKLRKENIDKLFATIENVQSASTRRQQQRPAAYRFELHDEKIGVVREPPEPRDREFAVDTYNELVAKARDLHHRLSGSNSARRLCDSVERLLMALGSSFDEMRPGVLLSGSRSIEADRAAFADELFPDALALMDDALQTLRDLLAAFPIVRLIEAEGLALQLDRHAHDIPAIQQEMDAVKSAAAQSGAVTEEALDALTQNDAAIEYTSDPVARTGLIADKLLVVGNFARAVLGGIAICGRTVRKG